jgi:opacity protein-like surface antigen
MAVLSGRLGLALVLVALCLSGRTAHAQAAPVPYWTPGWPLGFGGNLPDGQSPNAYGNFSGFDGSNAGGGGSTRYNFPNGWFVGSERGGIGLSGMQQGAAFGNFGGLYTEGMQFGYSFKNASGLPITFYGGLDTLKFNTGIGNPVSPFNPVSGTAGYTARAGIEIQPTSNLSLSLGVGYTQQSGRLDSDINSPLLPGASPFAFGGRR